ncbi:MAG: VTT domain-containing protein [Candidatus Moranbacteria bacterium]|nr:VTT domain-containing protein [Candidatus Moranbacteria bacterium]
MNSVHLLDITNFAGAFQWVIEHGYILMFFAMLIEGPIVTVAAAFAAALGYFDVFIVFILSFLGDIVADVIYYFIGYFSRLAVIEKFGKFFGLTEKRMHRIEALLNGHSVKTLIALKLTPVLPTPGLMLVGATKMSIKRFVKICSIIIFPRTIFLVIMGYYFGAAYEVMAKQFEKNYWIFIFIVATVAIVYYLFSRLLAYLGRRVEKI